MYENSINITKSLVSHVVSQQQILEIDDVKIKSLKNLIKTKKVKRNFNRLEKIRESLSEEKLRLLEVVSEPGASNWTNSVNSFVHLFYCYAQSSN